jgi:hypothetical protein
MNPALYPPVRAITQKNGGGSVILRRCFHALTLIAAMMAALPALAEKDSSTGKKAVAQTASRCC